MLLKTTDFRVKTSRQQLARPLATPNAPPQQQQQSTLRKKLSPIRLNKYSVFMDCLNDLTQQKFDKCQSRVLFQQIEEKVKKNQLLCILFIQNVTVYSKYDLPNQKIPPKFSWEAFYRGKTLILTTPYQYTKTCHGIVDFMFKSNAKHPLKLKLLKVKNYEEQYIGEIDLSVSDFVDFEVILEYQGKMIKETFVQKEMFKVYNDQSASIGQVSLKIIQFCSSSVPSNKQSNIPGSPKTQEMRKKHNQIEDYKTKGIDWGSSTNEEILIQQILECEKELEGKIKDNMSEIMGFIKSIEDQLLPILKEICFAEDINFKRRNLIILRKKYSEQELILIIKDLGQDYIEIFTQIRQLSKIGRVKRTDIDAALQTFHGEFNQLFLKCVDDFGMTIIDFLLESDSLPELLYFFNQLNVEKGETFQSFSNSLFENIRSRLRKNHYLKALTYFIKALGMYPSIGSVLMQYAIKPENQIILSPFFLEFDINNYQHVMVLSKLRKLCNKFLNPEMPFMQSMEKLYNKAKQETYFKIPILPKKVDSQEKLDLLKLPELGQNIFHEIVRRKRWNLFARAYKQFEDLIYEQDTQGISAMMFYLESAPMDQILKLDFIKSQISKSGQTSLHFLIMNADLSLNNLLLCLQKFNILNDKIWGGFSPLALLLDRLVQKQKKHKSRIIKELKSALDINQNKNVYILEMLSQNAINIIKHLNMNKYHHYCYTIPKYHFEQDLKISNSKSPFQFWQQTQKNKQIVEWDNFYHYHTVPALILCKLDEQIQELIWNQFSWINWLASKTNYPYETCNSQTLLISIAKTTQTQQIYQYLNKDIVLIYKDHENGNVGSNTLDLVPIFQQVYWQPEISIKLKEDIQKKHKSITEKKKEEENDTINKKIQIMYQNIAQQKYSIVLDQLLQEQQQTEGMLQNNFKFQGIVNELMIAKNLNFGKLFRKAYDSKFHNMLNFIDILLKALQFNNMLAAHMALYFAQLRMNKYNRVIPLKQNQQVYLHSLLTHWCIELDFNQFQLMINDIRDICQQNEVNYIILILAINGRYNKLKLIQERMTNQNYIIQALPIAAHQINQIRNAQYYDGLQKLLAECEIKKLYSEDSADFFKASKEKEKIKQEQKKPFDRAKPLISKWITLQGALTTQLQLIYKQSINSNQRIKSETSLLQKQFQILWQQEYSYRLRRLFTKQNFRCVFYLSKPRETDFYKTIELLIEKVLHLKLTPSDEFFNYVHVHDKFSELLSQSPNQNICIVQAFKSMINLFQNEQSNEIFQRCINFLKKYLNSKIFKDLNEPETFNKESDLFNKYLAKGDPNKSQCKFASEVLILMDQNFTTQEFETLNLIQSPPNCAALLLKYKSSDKRTIGFLQKYLNTSTLQNQLQLFLMDSNLKHIIDLAKSGINLLNDNPLEFLISKGLYSYLKEYFLSQLKPKGMLNDEIKLYYLGFAFQSGSQETIQLCIEDLCGLKYNEMKQYIIDGNLLSKAIVRSSQETLLFITRKILKHLTFTQKEIMKLLQIQDNQSERIIIENLSKGGKGIIQRSLFSVIFIQNYDIFYKEFFVDYLQKIFPTEYKSVMTKIFNSSITKEDGLLTVFQLALNSGFYDAIHSATQLNIQINKEELQQVNLQLLPQKWLYQTPQQLENLLKQEHYKQIYKQSALRMYRIFKYHFGRNKEQLKEIEINLNLAFLFKKYNVELMSKESIINLMMGYEIDPIKQPIVYIIKLHLDQVDKVNSLIPIESFCDKHPSIMHDKIYTQLIKNREAYELLRTYYPEQVVPVHQQISNNIPFTGQDNCVKDYFLLQDPKKLLPYLTNFQELIFSLKVLYDKNDEIESFYEALEQDEFIVTAALLLIILNPNKYPELVLPKIKTIISFRSDSAASPTTNIFKGFLEYFQSINLIFIFINKLISSIMNNPIYLNLIQLKPNGDNQQQISQDKQFLEDIKDAFLLDTVTLPDNIWSQIISSSSKATHLLAQDKWFNGLCLIKSFLHVCYSAETVIYDIQLSSKLDDYESPDFWGIQAAHIEIRAELFSSDQMALHKVSVQKEQDSNNWQIKYPLGMIKDTNLIFPIILTSLKGTEFAKNQLIQQIYDQTKYDILPQVENFSFESYSQDNIQQIISEMQKESTIIENPYTFSDQQLQYNGKQLANNYQSKRKNKKDFQILPKTTSITFQVISKEEFARREKYIYLFNQIIEDPPNKCWNYYIEKELIQSLKDDQLILSIYEMIKERLGVHIQLQSFIEYYFIKLGNGLEKLTKKTLTPKMCVDLGLQWEMLIKVIKHILSIIKFTKNICFELIEIDARKSFNQKLEGFDSIFRFGQAELQISQNLLIVKLSIAMLSNANFSAVFQNVQKNKQQFEIKEQIDLQQYLQFIFNETQLQTLN